MSRGSVYALGAGARKGLALFWTALLIATLLMQYVALVSPARTLASATSTASSAAANADQVSCGLVPVDVEIILDQSGSMGSNSNAGHTREYWAQQAASQLVSDLDANGGVGTGAATSSGGRHRVGLTTFHGTINSPSGYPGYTVASPLGSQNAAGTTTTINSLVASGNTPFKAGMAGGAADLTAHMRTTDFGLPVTHVIVFISDGRPNPDGPTSGWGNGTSQRPTQADATAFKGAAEQVFSIAIGSGGSGASQVDLALMQALAKPNDAAHYANVVDSSKLPSLFSDIFNTIACKTTPSLSTQVSTAAADFGGSVTDKATLTGSSGAAAGTVTFYVCGPTAQAQDCATGGTKVGNAVAVSTTSGGGTATSSAFTVGLTGAASGTYCWRAEYTPDASTNYNPATHTNSTTECFNVAPATISITKTANPAGPVTFGNPIGFDILVANTGTTTTLGVHVTDTLPTSVTGWAIDPAVAGCAITSGVLDCTKTSLAAGASFTVHVTGNPTMAACGTVDNTASVATSNDGSGSSKASVAVQCAAISITKVADKGTVNAGDQAGFTVTVSNTGDGKATGVSATDTLPAGHSWAIDGAANGWAIASGKLTWTGDLAGKTSTSVHIVATTSPADCAAGIDNTASVTSDLYPSDSASASVAVQCAAISITKVADKGTVNAGDQAGFTVTVSNTGDGKATGVSATDTLPAGHSWAIDGAANGWAIASGKLTWTGDLAGKTSTSVHIVATTSPADCAAGIDNTASVTSDLYPSDSASASVAVQCAAISITKVADKGTVNAGDQAGFTVTVSNTGDGKATGVSATDTLPAGHSWAIDGAANGWAIASGKLTWTGDLAGKTSTSVHIVATTSPADCAAGIDNTASVTSDLYPSDSASASVAVQCPDVTVVKTADNSPISAGETAAFTITVGNSGAGTAYGVTLSDPLPSGVDWTTSSAGCAIANGALTCSWTAIAHGDTKVVHVSGETTADNCGLLPNTAIVGASNEPEAATGNNRSSASVSVVCPKISIVKTADDPSVSASDQVGFTIKVTNNDTVTAQGVSVDDPLPTNAGLGWSIDSASPTQGWAIANGHLTYGPASLAPGASISVHIVSATTSATCGMVYNEANLTYTGGSGMDSSGVEVNCPDITITKTGNGPILAGQTASYTITVSNAGQGTAYDVVMTDPLPAGVDWTVSKDGCSITDGTLTCQVGTLEQDATFVVSVSGATTADNCGDLPNTASASASNEPRSNTDNDQASASIAVQCTGITLVKTAGDAANGDTLTLLVPGNVVFTYVVTNTGTADLQGLVLVDDNATPANPADDITVTCPSSTLAAGESMTCTATLPVGYGTHTNTATVTTHPVVDQEGTVSATDNAVVFVPQPEVTPTPTPKLTLPPTSTVDAANPTSQSGSGLLLLLVAIAGITLLAGYLVPAPARSRRRNRRS